MKSFGNFVVLSLFLILSGCGNDGDSTSGAGVSLEKGKPDRGDKGDGDDSSPTQLSVRWNKDLTSVLVGFSDRDGLSRIDGDSTFCGFEDGGGLGVVTDENETKFVNKRILVRCEPQSPIELVSRDCAIDEENNKPCGDQGSPINWKISFGEDPPGGKFTIESSE